MAIWIPYAILGGSSGVQDVDEEATSRPIAADEMTDKQQRLALAVLVGLGICPYLNDRQTML